MSARVGELLELVGLPARRAQDYPHELSGGQRQRVLIGLALACEPRLLVADEPTTALDVMVQAQVLRLLEDLQQQFGLGIIFITHDLSTLADICKRIAVMYAGRIVEQGPSEEVFAHAAHPYTRALGAAFPVIGDPAFRMNPSGRGRRSARSAVASERLPVPPALPGGGRDLLFHGRRAVARRRGARGRLRARLRRPNDSIAPRRAEPGASRKAHRVNSNAPLLEVRGLHVGYPVAGGRGAGRRRGRPLNGERRDPRARGRVWLRQDDARPDHHGPAPSRLGRGAVPGRAARP